VVADDNALLWEGIASLLEDDASGVGYLLKERVRDVGEFIDAVERVAAGGTAFDREVVKSLVDGHRRSASTN
jgi:DNA-binding NarL/FixJ family response regulator